MPLRIYRPIKTDLFTQGFYDNKPCAKTDSDGKPIRPYKIISPNDQNICPIGSTKFYPLMGMKGHGGEDWLASHGEEVYFPVVTQETGWYTQDASDSDGGIGVDVISKNPISIFGIQSYVKFRFWHLLRTVKGVDVLEGYLIGYADNTGASGGNHLHWGMKLCDKDGNALNNDNGFYGGVDFHPFFTNQFILDVLGVDAKKKSIQQQIIQIFSQIVALLQQKLDLLRK